MRIGLLATIAAVLSVAGSPVLAQHHPGAPSEAAPYGSPVADRHVWVHGILDQFEGRLGGGNAFRWDGEAWIGTDTHRLWLKSEAVVEIGE
jgi:copper resistance protein B